MSLRELRKQNITEKMCFAQRTSHCNFYQMFFIIVFILLLKLNCIQQNKHFAGGTVMNAFRFQNFEPRIFRLRYRNTSLVNTISPKSINHNERESRGFHFQATDMDVSVDVEFIIPFIKIPIGFGMKKAKTAFRSLLDLQAGSLLWSGAFIVIGAIIGGIINTLAALQTTFYPTPGFYGLQKQARGINNSPIDGDWERRFEKPVINDHLNNFENLLELKLLEHNIDFRACIKSSICNYIQRTTTDVRAGKCSSTQKIVDGLISAQILNSYLNGTAVQSAIEAGRTRNCDYWKRKCKIAKFGKVVIEKFFNEIF